MVCVAMLAAWIATFELCAQLPARASCPHDRQSGANSGGTVTDPLQIAVTGCLKQEGEGGEYFVVDKNGTTWKLTPNGMKLAEHVNQNVIITGKPDANAEQRDNDNRGGKAEPGGKPQNQVASPDCENAQSQMRLITVRLVPWLVLGDEAP